VQQGNAIRYTGSLELWLYFDGEAFGVSIVEMDDVAEFEQLSEIRLAPGKRFADDGEAFDEAARVAIGFAGLADERLYDFVQLDEENGDTAVVWRDRDTAALMFR
jgi:hypothetical protein